MRYQLPHPMRAWRDGSRVGSAEYPLSLYEIYTLVSLSCKDLHYAQFLYARSARRKALSSLASHFVSNFLFNFARSQHTATHHPTTTSPQHVKMPRRPLFSSTASDPEAQPGTHKLKTALALLYQHVAEQPPRGDLDKLSVCNIDGEHSRIILDRSLEEPMCTVGLDILDPELVFDTRTLVGVGRLACLFQPCPEVEEMQDDAVVNEHVPLEHQFEKAPNGNPVIPFKHVINPPIHYRSSSLDFMGKFLKTIYNRPEVARRVRSLKFSLPYDTLDNSGIMKLLSINMDVPMFQPLVPSNSSSPSSSSTTLRAESDNSDPDSDDDDHKTPIEIASWKFKMWIALFTEPSNIPLKTVLDMYVYLFSICKNVEQIEIPVEWEKDFTCGMAFPKVQSQDIYITEDK